MKLQLALDTLPLDECLKLLDETQDFIDIIEVGTPFIIEEGMNPVRVIKSKFPNILVLADTKIMDAGSIEAKSAFKAGADIITVLGAANDETIIDAVKVAQEFKSKVMVDMIAIKNLEERTQQIDLLGVDYICVHTAFDIQSTGQSPLDELKIVNRVIKNAKSAVAGGVKLSTVDSIVNEGTEIVIVGGAISNASNRAEMAMQIKHHLK